MTDAYAPLTAQELADWEQCERDRHPGVWWNEAGVLHAKATSWTEQHHACDHPASAQDTDLASADNNADWIEACTRYTARAIAELRNLREQKSRLLSALEQIVSNICPAPDPACPVAEERREIAERVEKATPGPWAAEQGPDPLAWAVDGPEPQARNDRAYWTRKERKQ